MEGPAPVGPFSCIAHIYTQAAMDHDLDQVARNCLGYRAGTAAQNLTPIDNAARRPLDLPLTRFPLPLAIARNVARTQQADADAPDCLSA